MGIWLRSPKLADSETVTWKHFANHSQSRNRAIGGRLYLTQTRLLFEPNQLDGATGGRSWHAPLGAIRAVGAQEADGSLFNGGLRRRLRLELSDGSVELFVVNKLDEVLGILDQAIRNA
ncbi:hypothetical protein [Nocardia sp. XZ_19_385]|uniref:hypothetical protein n=1 Tax=Nocardia sp. XZ_19_385 TaxID=2769488 RepID=UPI0018906485|nr:hypothetical protein [Nocardia sp. XZ_19_385]